MAKHINTPPSTDPIAYRQQIFGEQEVFTSPIMTPNFSRRWREKLVGRIIISFLKSAKTQINATFTS